MLDAQLFLLPQLINQTERII